MFKAQIIENPRYYKLLRFQSLIMIVLFVPYASILSSFDLPAWTSILVILFYLVMAILIIQNHKNFRKLLARKQLEINEDQIRLVNSKHLTISEWEIRTTDTIITNKDFSLPNDRFRDIVSAWRGGHNQNFLELKKEGDDVHFEFHLDSDYMRVQINKLIDSWISKGIKVKRV